MRVQVDEDRCEGFGVCNQHLPEVFELDEWGYASVEGDGTVPDGKEDLARRAIDACPVFAISEVTGGGETAGAA